MNFGETGSSALSAEELDAVLSTAAAGIAVVCAHPKGIKLLYTNDCFYDIFGYTREEYENSSDEKLVSLVDGDDLQNIFGLINSDFAPGRVERLEFAIRRKSGETGHILLSVSKPDLPLAGKDCFVCNIVDITETKQMLAALEKERERYTILSQLSDNIFFSYDIKNDVFESSSKMMNNLREVFRFENASEIIGPGKTFDSADIPIVSYALEQAVAGQQDTMFDARIIGENGERVWYRTRFRTVFDSDGKAQRFVGTMANINRIVKERQRLIEKAQTDELTGCLNKISAQNRIDELLEHGDGRTGALFVADIDNFKQFNDTCGHAAGDGLLRSIAKAISACVRSDDVFGRVGGDEFAVYLNDFDITKEAAGKKAEELLAACRSIKSVLPDGAPVTMSIGIAISPADGESFSALFEKADSALYAAKENGKNSYVIFSEPHDGTNPARFI